MKVVNNTYFIYKLFIGIFKLIKYDIFLNQISAIITSDAPTVPYLNLLDISMGASRTAFIH